MSGLPSLNMTTGPVEVSSAVLDAQRAAFTSPHIGDFWSLHDETLSRLGRIMETTQSVLAFPGSIRAGLNVAIGNFVGPHERVLAISNGYWGELIGQMCRERGAEVIDLALPPLLPIDPDQVRAALAAAGSVDLVTIVHAETNVGIMNPIDRIGPIVREAGALFFVDTACSAGATSIGTDRCGIDVGVTGSHKCLASLPGLCVLTVSDRAWERLSRHPREVGFYNLTNIRRQTIERPAPPPYTQPAGLFAALHEALGEIEARGIDNWFDEHRRAGRLVRDQLRAFGLTILPDLGAAAGRQDEAVYSDAVIAVGYPDGIDDEAFRAQLGKAYGVFVIGNVGDWSGRSFRMGLMSPPQLEPANVQRTLSSIEQALDDLKVRRAKGAAGGAT